MPTPTITRLHLDELARRSGQSLYSMATRVFDYKSEGLLMTVLNKHFSTDTSNDPRPRVCETTISTKPECIITAVTEENGCVCLTFAEDIFNEGNAIRIPGIGQNILLQKQVTPCKFVAIGFRNPLTTAGMTPAVGRTAMFLFNPVATGLSRSVQSPVSTKNLTVTTPWTVLRDHVTISPDTSRPIEGDVKVIKNSGEERIKYWYEAILKEKFESFHAQRDSAILFGQEVGTTIPLDAGNQPISAGNGLLASYGNIKSMYNGLGAAFSLDAFEATITDMLMACNEPVAGNKLLIVTGSAGLTQFSKAIAEKYGRQFTDGMLFKGNMGNGINTLFDGIMLANGVTLTIYVEPMFDRMQRVDSKLAYSYFFLPLNAKDMIELCYYKSQEPTMRYIYGMRGLEHNQQAISTDLDGSTLLLLHQFALTVKRPDKLFSIEPAI